MKTMKTLALVLAAGLVATGCTRNEEMTPQIGGQTMKVVVSDQLSRTTFTDGEGFAWENSDNAAFTMMIEGNGSYSAKASAISIAEGKATFTLPTVEVGSNVWFLYTTTFNAPGGKFEATFKPDQTQEHLGMMGRDNIVLRSHASYEITEGLSMIEPTMDLIGTVQRFLVYSPTGVYADDKIESIRMEAAQNIAGLIGWNANGRYHDNGGNELDNPVIYWSHSSKANVVIENPEKVEATSKDETLGKGIYLAIAPVEVAAGYTYTITTDKHVFKMVASTAKSFQNGVVMNIPVNLESSAVACDDRVDIVWDAKSERNLWLQATNKTYAFHYGPGWNERHDYVWEPDDANNFYSVYYPAACWGQWMNQLRFSNLGLSLSESKKYDFHVILNASKDVNNVTIKFDDGIECFYNPSINLKANTDLVFTVEDFQGKNINGGTLVLDFGFVGNETTITMRDFILWEHDGGAATDPVVPGDAELAFTCGDGRMEYNFSAEGGEMNTSFFTTTFGGETIDLANIEYEVEYIAGEDWLNVTWHHYHFTLGAAFNPTAEAREARIYFTYTLNGTTYRSTNYSTVKQAAGTGETVVRPVLTKSYDTDIVAAGETIATAATISLVDHTNAPLDYATYINKVNLSINNGATLTLNSDATISVVFPANDGGAKTYTLTATGTNNLSATVAFHQEAAAGVAAPKYGYTVENVANLAIGTELGFGVDNNPGVYFRITDVYLYDDPTKTHINLQENTDVRDEVIALAIRCEAEGVEFPAWAASREKTTTDIYPLVVYTDPFAVGIGPKITKAGVVTRMGWYSPEGELVGYFWVRD